ncbi:MAG TPA: family 2 encapsulin nanocompartment cargo protein polyprenyl transferase [Pseudonocardiaceae bacterium]
MAHRSAAEVLTWGRVTVEPALRAAVDGLPTPARLVAGYHFGWWDESGRAVEADRGKAVRPALALLAAEAVGGCVTAATPAAVAVELVHNFSLLHDDVMDRDTTRRHRPTAWSVFGISAAILAGDALLTLALDVLAGTGRTVAPEATRTLSAAVQRLIDGQCADTDFERRSDVTLADCVRMAENKTGALLGAACALGALFGGGSPGQVRHLSQFGSHLGLAFQHVDDLLGIWGDPAVTGKPAHSDLANRKKSLPVVAALQATGPQARELHALYQADAELTPAQLTHAATLVERAGGRTWSRHQADTLLAAAQEDLRAVRPAPRPAAELTALALLATHRDH